MRFNKNWIIVVFVFVMSLSVAQDRGGNGFIAGVFLLKKFYAFYKTPEQLKTLITCNLVGNHFNGFISLNNEGKIHFTLNQYVKKRIFRPEAPADWPSGFPYKPAFEEVESLSSTENFDYLAEVEQETPVSLAYITARREQDNYDPFTLYIDASNLPFIHNDVADARRIKFSHIEFHPRGPKIPSKNFRFTCDNLTVDVVSKYETLKK